MSTEIKCPACGSIKTMAVPDSAAYLCYACRHEFTPARIFAPLRIFLSYGHDDNEALVRLIKAELEKRGHDVWFDKDEIKFSDNWRREITDGIVKSHRVLSFLSRYSTRDPGVCRDEIAIAIGVKGGNIQTVLVESEQEVQPPVNIGHIQWLDMHDWKEKRDAGPAEWEPWYQARLAEIIQVVESDESRRFAGEIENLGVYLQPINSDARIGQLLGKGFCGRQWLFEAVENWRLDATQDSRLFWIMGAPGVGKSAFAAQLTHTRGDTVIAAQFCEWDKSDHRDAGRVIRSIAFQLAARLPDYRKLLLTLPEIAKLDRKGAAELFEYLLSNPLHQAIKGGRERYLIVIDALDEAGEAGHNPLVEILAGNAQRLPKWLGFVVTSRPEFDVRTPFQALNPLPLDTRSQCNHDDIRDYLGRELASQLKDRPDADSLMRQILAKSEGVFLYVERLCDDLRRGLLSLDSPGQFPQGLGGIFDQYFKRQFPDLEKFRTVVRPALRAILAAREPLPVEILQRLFHWPDEELRDFIRPLASLFPVTTEARQRVIKPYHKSLPDWLTDEAKAGGYFVSTAEGNAALARLFWDDFSSNIPLAAEKYWAHHAISHLSGAKREADAEFIARSDKFFLIQATHGIVPFDLFVSYARKDNADGRVAELIHHIDVQYRTLTGKRLRIFFDTDALPGADDHMRHLYPVRRSKIFLCILSPSYFESAFCRWEFDEYHRHQDIRREILAPIYFIDVEWLRYGEINQRQDSWAWELRRLQRFDLRSWFHAGEKSLGEPNVQGTMTRLVERIRDRISEDEVAESSKGNVSLANVLFSGRHQEMRLLQELVAYRRGVPTILYGLGGIGKTALALAYSAAYALDYPGGRWQINCKGHSDLRTVLMGLAGAPDFEFEFSEEEKRDPNLGLQGVIHELKRRADAVEPNRVLLILDNVDRTELLADAHWKRIPPADWLHIIATTRLSEAELGLGPHDCYLAIDELSEKDAVDLIERWQPGGKVSDEAERQAAHEIARLIGGFTLAVEVVAIFLGQNTEVTCVGFKARLEREGLRGLEMISHDPGLSVRHEEKSLIATIAPTLDQLSPPEKLAMVYAARMPADNVVLSSIRALVAEKFPEFGRNAEPGESEPWLKLVEKLLGLRLLNIGRDPDTLRINPVVQAVVKHRNATETS
jgi:hypothetical protein